MSKKIRYICSFVKKDENGKFKSNVVVIPASNSTIARSLLCERYKIRNIQIEKEKQEGIKSIRMSETNKYEGGDINANFEDNDT